MEKYGRTMRFYTVLVKISVVLRLIFGPTIFLMPRVTALIEFIIDWVDGELYKRAGYAQPQYSLYDKILDYYWYIWILIYILVNNIPFRSFFILLFAYRSFGQILYLITKKEIMFLLFPNIFEIFFLYYLVVTIPGKTTPLLLAPAIWIALASITVIVLFREYILHLRRSNLSRLILGHATFWPKATYNPYKVFGFIVFLFAVFLSYSLIYQAGRISYKTQAEKASKEGRIISYDSQGALTGWIKGNIETYSNVFLFNDRDYSVPLCQGKVSISKISEERSIIIYQDKCLINLIDNTYYLLLVPLNKSNKSYVLEFIVTNKQLQQ